MARYDVFISYRREGGAETARLLRIALSQHGYQAFLDVDDLASGHFDDRLLQLIAETPHFIVILSPGALDCADDPHDWLRQELQQALTTDRNIVPLLMPGFVYPDPNDLCPELAGIERHNGIAYSHHYFDATVHRLVQYLTLDEQSAKQARAQESENQTSLSAPPDVLDADAYRAFVPLPATPLIVLGLLTAWTYVALAIGRALVAHLQGRQRYFEHSAQTPGLPTEDARRGVHGELAGPAFDIDPRWPARFAFGLAIAGIYTLALFVYFPVYRNPPLTSLWPLFMVGVASLLFYVLVTSFVFWFRNALKRHDRYERLLFRSLHDPRIGPNTLPERDFSGRWENHDQHVALFVIVGLPVMFSPTFVAWYVLYAMAAPVGELIAPVWLLVIAAAYHLWGVRLLRRLYHDHLSAEQA